MLQYKISIVIILVLFIIHFFGDYVGQTKCLKNEIYFDTHELVVHCAFYSGCFIFLFPLVFTIWQVLFFIIVTFICHFTVDLLISTIRLQSSSNKKVKVWLSILDLFLHYIQLIMTYVFTIKFIK